MYQNRMKNLGIAILSLGIVFFALNCGDYEDETFQLGMTDEQAAAIMLADTIFANLETVALQDTTGKYYITTTSNVLDSISNSAVTNVISYLKDSIAVTTVRYVAEAIDSLYQVKLGKNIKENYTVYNSNHGGNTVIYVNDFVNLKLIAADGTVLSPIDDTMPLELSSGFYVLENQTPQPVVKTRCVFTVENKDYLLQITVTESTKNATLNMTIVNE